MISYEDLVAKRKRCRDCEPDLVNPARSANEEFDSAEIGPWTLWQGDRGSPKLMIVGQDWGTFDDFRNFRGRDFPGAPTNCTIKALLDHVGVCIAQPGGDNQGRQSLFFTNAVLCLRDHLQDENVQRRRRNADPPRECFDRCARSFLGPTIELVAPRFRVSLGNESYASICQVYSLRRASTLKQAVQDTPAGLKLPIGNGTTYFPMFHCGPRGSASRPLVKQLEDWTRMTTCADWVD